MADSIGEVKEKLQAACEKELPAFVTQYEGDTRIGVQKCVETARKRLAALEKERQRTEKLWEYERSYGSYSYICGIDEAGRGPLAGPVVAGAVILPKDCDLLYINDSKQLSEKKREELYTAIMEKALCCGIGYASPQRIDEIN
ncbi:MAG: ribonuclease HII, partial [Acetatifactor sp.]|nr:ribonuclease HII [Acetatifactor sp.]